MYKNQLIINTELLDRYLIGSRPSIWIISLRPLLLARLHEIYAELAEVERRILGLLREVAE